MPEPDDSARAPTEAVRRQLSGVGIWTAALDFVPAAQAQELAAELDELRYRAIWLPEVAGRDVFVHLALLLAVSRRLVGATGIANIWARDAVTMKGAVDGLTEAFPDRFVAGLGVSHHTLVEDLRGHEYRQPLAAMRGYLDHFARSPYTAVRPQAREQVVLGALGPRMTQLAAARCAGTLTYLSTPEHSAWARELLGSEPLLCVEQAVVLEHDPDKARALARAHIGVYSGLPNYQNHFRRLGFEDSDFTNGASNRLVDSMVAWGGPEELVRRVAEHFDAGADHVCVQMLCEGRRRVPTDQWRELAQPLSEAVPRRSESPVAATQAKRARS